MLNNSIEICVGLSLYTRSITIESEIWNNPDVARQINGELMVSFGHHFFCSEKQFFFIFYMQIFYIMNETPPPLRRSPSPFRGGKGNYLPRCVLGFEIHQISMALWAFSLPPLNGEGDRRSGGGVWNLMSPRSMPLRTV